MLIDVFVLSCSKRRPFTALGFPVKLSHKQAQWHWQQCMYELVSILLHYGATATSGQYTDVVRAQGQWFVSGDSHVT